MEKYIFRGTFDWIVCGVVCGAGDGIVMRARGPGLSTQFPHLMLIITQPIGTVEEVNNKHGPSITVPSVGGDQDQGNAPNISVGDREPSHQVFTQHQ